MKPGTGPKIVMALLGACFAQFGVATLWIWSIGDFTAGKTAAFAMGVGCLVIAVVATASVRLMVRALVMRIPPKFEQDLGDKFFAELQQEETFIQDTNLQAKLDLAVTPLLSSLPTNQIQFRFHIVEMPIANAFALPGGHVVVTTGLMKLVNRRALWSKKLLTGLWNG